MLSSTVPAELSNDNHITENGISLKGQDASSTHEEHQYLKLIREIFQHGELRPDRYIILGVQIMYSVLTQGSSEQGLVLNLSSHLRLSDFHFLALRVTPHSPRRPFCHS